MLVVVLWASTSSATSPSAVLRLDGGPLAADAIFAVASAERRVEIEPAARQRAAAAFDAILAAARAGMPVYGLTTGVGWNKDKRLIAGRGALDPDLLAASRRFNLNTLRAHAAGMGSPLSDEVVRASMLIRLNVLLSGVGGVQPAVVDQYAAFLNCGIVPVVPGHGTVGQADILQAAHIGLALAGEWRVRFRGRTVPTRDALADCGLAPVELVGKDFLAILGSNALTVAHALYSVRAARDWLDRELTVFALSLEGLNGNVAPFLEAAVEARPVPGLAEVAARLRADLAGSSLWQRSADRPLQDPLSFRTMPVALAAAWAAIAEAEATLLFLANHSDDNPAVLVEATTLSATAGTQVDAYRVPGTLAAAILPTGNFDALPLVGAVERVSWALGRVAESVSASVLRFENPELTGLPRFLTAPGSQGHGFGAVQKAVVALNSEIRSLAAPVSLDGATLAGNIEDVITNSQLAVRRLEQIIDRLYPLATLQLLHAAQAVDLRSGRQLGIRTARLHAEFRREVPFADRDLALTDYLAGGERLLRAPATPAGTAR
jgi:histidine ammonia-lyase